MAAIFYSLNLTDDRLTYTISNILDNKGVNLIFEEFTTDNLTNIVNELNNECKKFLIISEFFSKDGFNIFSWKERLLNLLNLSSRYYLKSRYRTFKSIIKKVKFDGFILLHPSIDNRNFRHLLSKSINSNVEIQIFLPILPTKNISREFSNLELVKKQSDQELDFNDLLYFQNNPDVQSIWESSACLHYFRYGKHENRSYVDKYSDPSFIKVFNLLQADSLKKYLPKVNIYSSGAPTPYRNKVLASIKNSPKVLLPLGFLFEVEIEKGWDTYNYSVEDLFSETMSDVSQLHVIDLAVSQTESWPFISPIRIWRSYACGLFPIRFCNVVDNAHPLQKVIEQVNQDYQVVSYSWALREQFFRRNLLTEIEIYNESAICEIKKLVAALKFES
jgi:hypothetical protein